MKYNNLGQIFIFSISMLLTTSCIDFMNKFKKDKSELSADNSNSTSKSEQDKAFIANLNTVDKDQVSGSNFYEISQSMSYLTGVNPSRVSNEYKTIKTQLPPSSDVKSFSAFNQVATTRLAFAYCDIFINENDSFNDVDTASSDIVANKLMAQFVSEEISAAHKARLKADLISLIDDQDDLINDLGNESNPRIANRDKEYCASDVGSRSMKCRKDESNKIKGTKMACTAILGSPFISLSQ